MTRFIRMTCDWFLVLGRADARVGWGCYYEFVLFLLLDFLTLAKNFF